MIKNSDLHGAVNITDCYPEIVKLLINEIESQKLDVVNLVGYSSTMRWLARLLSERSCKYDLFDFHKKYIDYDCSSHFVKDFKLNALHDAPIVICPENPASIKEWILKICLSDYSSYPVIFNTPHDYNPIRQDKPFSTIIKNAERRAISMISDSQLFDLIQLIKLTKDLKGDVVEFGSLYGGSGAVFAESLLHFGIRNLFLCDTFSGIPKAYYGVDNHWTSSFSDNSFCEVRDAFSDLEFVNVIKGDVFDTASNFDSQLSLVYVGTDTFSSAKFLFEKLWGKIQSGGLFHICDYGSYPNCLPITAFCDYIESNNPKLKAFRTSTYGIYFVKP